MLTGLACKGVLPANVRNRADLFRLSEPAHVDMIEGLFAMAHRDLENDQPGFDLLLPDGDASQLERGEAISSWCQGFITGLCHEDTAVMESEEDEVREAIASIMEIGHLELDLDDPDGNERALVEVEEFLRVAVQLVYDHLQPASGDTSVSAQTLN